MVEPVVEEVKQPARPAYQATKKFERSPVISPIYGIERPESKEDIELENTAPAPDVSEIIAKQHAAMLAHPKIGADFPYRKFTVPAEDQSAHDEFMAKITA